jgi:predicted PurR-regulated permease PerM
VGKAGAAGDVRVHLPTIRPDERDGADGARQTEIDAVQLRELATVFSPPRWLDDLGRSSWLLVGAIALLVGAIWLLAATETIVGPVLAATIVATVASPVASSLARHMPRPAAAAVVLLALVGVAVLVAVLVVAGIVGQSDEIGRTAGQAAARAQSWLESAGVDRSGAADARSAVEADVPKVLGTLLGGLVSGIRGLASLVFGLSLGALSLFFLLKDGPRMRAWADRHLGVPEQVARTISSGVIVSLRGYFRGVTLVAAFNAAVVAVGALLLDVPLVGTLAVVTFVAAYVPFMGALVAGTFAVVIALGAGGAGTAAGMLVVVLLANGLLQNLVSPFAMGAALHLNPLVVLVVTIGAGCLFGTLGLILAAPLLSAAVHITADLGRARAVASLEAEPAPVQARAPLA